MPSYLTSTTLIQAVERKAHIPEAQVTFQDQDFLAFANEEMMVGLVPTMMQFHQEFLVVPYTVPVTQGISSYPIPDRAIGNKLRSVNFVDSQGNMYDMARILPEDAPYFINRSTVNYPSNFYIENNSIIFVPAITGTVSGSFLLKIFQRPNQLVTEDQVSTIQSIDFTTGQIVVDQVPSTFTLGSEYDLLEQNGAHKWKGTDLPIAAINATTNTLTIDTTLLPDNQSTTLLPGDMICLAGQCFIPQVPDELHSLLAERVVMRCLEAQGDNQALQIAQQKVQEIEQRVGILIDNRAEGTPLKVNNIRGNLRFAKIRRRRYLY
jgi:hypothetical protein